MSADRIFWAAVSAAVAHYASRGWRQVEVPWLVPPEVVAITCPRCERVMSVPGHGDLVGSAEQSFLHLDGSGRLGRGRFLAVTPCFRDEPVVDRLHLRAFLKVELYRNDRGDGAALQEAIADAVALLRTLVPRHFLGIERTDEGFDLTVGGIEVGSYGIRRHAGLEWVCGTGLAEPRLSPAIAMAGQS